MKTLNLKCLVYSILIFLVQSTFANTAVIKKPIKLAIVHSYNKNFYWSKNVLDGFLEKLSQNYIISIVYENELDSKNNPNDVESKAKSILKDLVKTDFGVLFITDDDALNLAGLNFLVLCFAVHT